MNSKDDGFTETRTFPQWSVVAGTPSNCNYFFWDTIFYFPLDMNPKDDGFTETRTFPQWSVVTGTPSNCIFFGTPYFIFPWINEFQRRRFH